MLLLWKEKVQIELLLTGKVIPSMSSLKLARVLAPAVAILVIGRRSLTMAGAPLLSSIDIWGKKVYQWYSARLILSIAFLVWLLHYYYFININIINRIIFVIIIVIIIIFIIIVILILLLSLVLLLSVILLSLLVSVVEVELGVVDKVAGVALIVATIYNL